MPDSDRIGANKDLLDEEPNDFSATDQIQTLCVAL
jgi:hypothetical protein